MAELTKTLVLIVDDVQTNIEFITEIVGTLENTEIYGVNNGQQTFDFVSKRKPDLILLDVSMPKMDGYEVCSRIKADPRYSDISIIFLTARVQKEDIVKGFDVGAVDYIIKPFNMSELLSRVKTHIDLRNKTKELKYVNLELEKIVKERTSQLIESNRGLTEANLRLTEAYRQLSTLDRAKNDFIAHINHELRTPLNGIMGYTSLLSELSVGKEASNYIKSINLLVLRLIKVAEISLLFTELRTVDHNITLERVNLSDIVQRSIDSIESNEKELHIEISNIDGSMCALGEPRLLITCISIILDNAVKYSPQSGKIQISSTGNEQNIFITISDEGPGFSELARTRLFQLFTADNLEQRSYGLGIGLATAKHIIDLMDGEITIENKESKGAMVFVRLKKFNGS
jgi:two-component system, sensor histidine kinase and response regulator